MPLKNFKRNPNAATATTTVATLLLFAGGGCQFAGNRRTESDARRATAAPGPRLDEQSPDMRRYLEVTAQAAAARTTAEQARDAFVLAGSPEPLKPALASIHKRATDLEMERGRMQSTLARQPRQTGMLDPKVLPPGTGLRLTLSDRKGLRERSALGLRIKLDRLRQDGRCNLDFRFGGEKFEDEGLRAGLDFSAFHVRGRVEAVDPQAKTVVLWVRPRNGKEDEPLPTWRWNVSSEVARPESRQGLGRRHE